MPVRPRSALAVGVVLAAAGLLGGCGGDDGPARPATVTVTPTVTASALSSAPSSTAPPATTSAAPPVSDVTGRAFDLGTITATSSPGGVTVIELDRWTVKGLDDAKLATDGYPVRVIAKSPFSNQNASLTYGIPITADATVLYHHCASPNDPMQTRSATVSELAELRAPENVVVAELDADGQATSLQNYPVCA